MAKVEIEQEAVRVAVIWRQSLQGVDRVLKKMPRKAKVAASVGLIAVVATASQAREGVSEFSAVLTVEGKETTLDVSATQIPPAPEIIIPSRPIDVPLTDSRPEITPSPTVTKEPTVTPTVIAEPTRESTQTSEVTPTAELTPTTTPTPEIISSDKIRVDRVILPVPLDAQDFSLSCESSASAMAAAYFKPQPPEGFPNWEEYFVKTVPLDCNPHKGFRGKIDGYLSTMCEAPYGYGVYAEPIAAVLQQAGIPARVEYGVDYEAVAKAIREGKVVIVWISGRKDTIPQFEKDPESGEKYVLLLGEHVWTIVGVEGEEVNRRFLINDPWEGRQYWVKGFPRWDVFEGMRVVVGIE